MADSRKFVKIFLGSPGDLKDERIAARAVVDEFNKQWGNNLGIHVELVGWEDTVSRYGRPQELINQDLDQCEVFIGMMWKHWGTQPASGEMYTSGFEEEFERSVAKRKTAAKPEISLLFKDVDPELLKDPGEALRKVIAFKNKIINERTVLFQTFNNLREFEEKLRSSITSYVQNLKAEEAQITSDETQAKSPDGQPSQQAPYTPLSRQGAQFVREFVANSERDQSAHPISPVDVARFRLLGSMVGVSGNDEVTLGAHDANLIFLKRANLSLGRPEMVGLIECGLDNFSSENVPLWHWYNEANAEEEGDLSFISITSSPTVRVGALAAMTRVLELIKPLPPIGKDLSAVPRARFLDIWFSSSSSEQLKAAALEYLAACGTLADLPVIQKEYDRSNYQTKAAAIDALIRVHLRQSREAAINAIYELQPESVNAALVRAVFSKPNSLETTSLTDGAVHRSVTVRRAVVPILVARHALDNKIAEGLLQDTDATIRYQALRSLEQNGRKYTVEQARSVLIKPAKPGGFGVFGYGGPMHDSEGEAQWNRYVKENYRAMSEAALAKLASDETIFDRDARFALDYKKFSRRAGRLRASIDDQFKSEFASAVLDMEQKLGAGNETVEKTKGLDEYLRKQLTRAALDVLEERSAPEDLQRVRSAVQVGFVDYSDLDVEYLKRHGEWQDATLLISLGERRDPRATLLANYFSDEKARGIAAALYTIGRDRFSELIILKMPDNLLARLIARAADRDIMALGDDDILRLCLLESDKVRKAIALKSIKALPSARLKRLLDRYNDQSANRYYNVIHWLDMGVSVQKHRVKRAVDRVIEKEWPLE